MIMLKATRHFLLAVLVGLCSFSCTKTPVDSDNPTPSAGLQAMRASFGSLAGEWVLTNYKNQPLAPTLQNRATLVLKKQTDETLEAGGRSFVNYYGGSFSLDESKGLVISTNGLISTKMAGSAEDMQAETTYYNNLEKAIYFELANTGQLLLYIGPKGDASTEVLYFSKK
ncbi:META domain-containing protein [Spirosoma endbachense]|uniref:META domain-containing protein n=2 Tax=Spirosoma endbachense TaxID=2666025 RepID=A0A6P1VVQ7_9BACT|nr:META domain-containing protein [Spirosoma endbachense]